MISRGSTRPLKSGTKKRLTSNQEQKRLIEHVRTRYRKNDLTDLLPLGALESLALPGESYKLAFTPGLLTQVYGNRVDGFDVGRPTAAMSTAKGMPTGGFPRGGFSTRRTWPIHRPRSWRLRSNTSFYRTAPAIPSGTPPSRVTTRTILLLKQTTDPLGNRTTAEHDYRVLQPFRMTDPNGNRAEVAFDTLGLVAGTAVMGKTTETKGDSLAGFVPDLTPQQRQDFLADPLGHAALLLGQATTRIVYDLDRYRTTQQPVFAATLARETHVSDPLPPGGLKVQVSLSYSDGFGREIQKKIQAEPGPRRRRAGPTVSPRWVGSGWTIFNNKGKPVSSMSHSLTTPMSSDFGNQVGVSSTLFYDPVERVVATLHPNHTWEKVVFDPWRQESWDVNDTVLIADPEDRSRRGRVLPTTGRSRLLPTWHAQRQGGALGPEEQAAAAKTAVHAGTPVGRPCRLARADLPHGRAQPVRAQRHAHRRRRSYSDARRLRHRRQPARSASTPKTASSCATTTTCSARRFIRPAWRRASAGC